MEFDCSSPIKGYPERNSFEMGQMFAIRIGSQVGYNVKRYSEAVVSSSTDANDEINGDDEVEKQLICPFNERMNGKPQRQPLPHYSRGRPKFDTSRGAVRTHRVSREKLHHTRDPPFLRAIYPISCEIYGIRDHIKIRAGHIAPTKNPAKNFFSKNAFRQKMVSLINTLCTKVTTIRVHINPSLGKSARGRDPVNSSPPNKTSNFERDEFKKVRKSGSKTSLVGPIIRPKKSAISGFDTVGYEG
ncbi:hypothetical protein LXL04_024438 [Taraxacum kok-saghyz]